MAHRHLPFLIGIETDATRYHGEQPVLPTPLDRAGAEQLLAHIAADLGRLFPGINQYPLAMPAALYDQTQVLRPGYPLMQALEPLLRDSHSQSFTPSLLSIGAVDGQLPVAELQPDPDIPPGILQILVLLLSGDAASVDALEEEMEHRFMDEGQLSPVCARALEAQFGVAVNHARFMTLTDLEAMLRLQMEHFGFLPLWTLMDAALRQDPEQLQVDGNEGQHWKWDGNRVTVQFETFDYWANQGAGKAMETAQLQAAYCAWTRGLRRYLVTLQAHAVEVEFCLPGEPLSTHENPAQESYILETVPAKTTVAASVTEHCPEDIGTLAVTVVQPEALQHYYPLSAQGLNDLHEAIGRQQTVEAIAFPGGICFDPDGRCLMPEPLPAQISK